MRNKNIFLVGADTGGHVAPVYALAKEFLEKTKFRVVIIGVGSSIEKRFYQNLKEAKYCKIIAGKFQFSSVWNNFFSLLKTAVGFIQAIYLVIRFRPKVVFLKGNYATIPVAYVARLLGIPVFAHESDAVIGKSNQLISKFAKKVFLSFPEKVFDNKGKNFEYVGPILRPELEKKTSRNYERFGFDQKLKTVLVVGGSQGAHSINETVFKSLEKLASGYQIIHQTGVFDVEKAKSEKKLLDKKFSHRYYFSPFFEDINQAVAIADVVVSRASSTVFELASFKKAAILIPYPHASLDHQKANARYFENMKAAVVIDEKNLSPTILYSSISKMLTNDKRRTELENNLSKSLKTDGRKIVFEYLNESMRS